ncbi:sensor histidine kinase [Desmospora activa]|nr:sensor histidine kinase [Desmospora activa]
MKKSIFHSRGFDGVHLTFIILLFVLFLPDNPFQDIPVLLIHFSFMVGYLFIIVRHQSWWNQKRYIFVVCTLAIVVGIIRLIFPDYPDHRIFWPLLYLLGIAEPKWSHTTNPLAVITVMLIFVMMMIDQLSVGALFAAVLMYFAVRNQSLLRLAHQTNQKQLAQLNAAYSELQQTSIQAMGYAALTERTRLAREIHDGLGHQMTSLIVQLQALKLMIPNDPVTATNNVDELLKVARTGMEEVRLAVREWSEDEKGLGPIALKGLVSQVKANSRLQMKYKEIGPLSEWPVERSVILYRVLQEALTNILKHADANQVHIYLEEKNKHVKLIISDDGHFSSEKTLTIGFGLGGMMERCKAVGGSIQFTPNSPHGLKIEAVIPLES